MGDGMFLQEPGAVVGQTLIQLNGQTFSTPNVTSVRVAMKSMIAFYAAAGLCVLVGFSAFNADVPGFGLMCLVAAVLLAWPKKSDLYLVTAGGEVKALSAPAARCQRIQTAIVQAMHAAARR
jgi:hypothetical protein